MKNVSARRPGAGVVQLPVQESSVARAWDIEGGRNGGNRTVFIRSLRLLSPLAP